MKGLRHASAAFVLGGVLSGSMPGVESAAALPAGDPSLATTTAAFVRVQAARLVCGRYRCWHTGPYRWVRPYGYYRPYYWGPRLGIGVGPFGVRIF